MFASLLGVPTVATVVPNDHMLMQSTAMLPYALAKLLVGGPPHAFHTTRSMAPRLIEPADELLSLQVSSPALLLNHMAERYTSTSRILMEFVDNSLDDAESLYDSAAGAYFRPVNINVHVSRRERTLRIVDDCTGMQADTLSRVVMRVGESKKRGASFVNGQFGFGMQAFRAACSTLIVSSRTEEATPAVSGYQIRVDREQSDGFRLEALEATAFGEGTGTEVVLANFDQQWVDDTFRADVVAREIESHFERLLDRGSLVVRVWDADEPSGELDPSLVCRPLDYAALSPGASVKVEVLLSGEQLAECNLCVLPVSSALSRAADDSSGPDGASRGGVGPSADRSARFFASGRRIAGCGSTSSFAKLSSNRWTVWSHPQVVGYIDIRGARDGPLQPVITRDEFKNTRGRTAAYEAIIAACEGPLEAAIEAANLRVSEKSLLKLEDTITAVLAGVAEKDREAATARERLEKQEQRKKRAVAAAEKAAVVVETAAVEAMARTDAEQEAVRPFTEKMASGLGGLLSDALAQGADSLANALNPSLEAKVAEAAAAAALEEEAAARQAAEAKRKARRLKRLAPPPDEFTVRLVRGLVSDATDDPLGIGEGSSSRIGRPRSLLVGSTILVDSCHPDFKARWRQTRQGAPKVDERLCGYLATIVSSHYRERTYQTASRSLVDYAQAYDEMIETYCCVEEGLRAVLPALLREMDEQGQ